MNSITEKLPCTIWACPSLKQTLDCPNISTTRKVASVALRCLLVYPILFLLADGIYNLYLLAERICHLPPPASNPQPLASNPPPASEPGLPPVSLPPIIAEPGNQALVPMQRIANVAKPIALDQTIPRGIQKSEMEDEAPLRRNASFSSPNAKETPQNFDSERGYKALLRMNSYLDDLSGLLKEHEERIFPELFGFSGQQMTSALFQLRVMLPKILALPIEESETKKFPIVIHTQNGQRLRRKFSARELGDVLRTLASCLNRIEPSNLPMIEEGAPPASNLPTVEENEEESFENIFHSEVAGVRSDHRTQFQKLTSELHRIFLDPNNPEKGQKYLYALSALQKRVQKVPSFEKEILTPLKEQMIGENFAFHAHTVLNTLFQFGSKSTPIRDTYALVLTHLRDAIQKMPAGDTSPLLNKTKELICELSGLKFTGVHLYPFLEDFVSKALHAPQNLNDGYQIPELTLENIADEIQKANERLSTAPPVYQQQWISMNWKKLQGTVGWNFDPTSNSNTPWVHSVQIMKTAQGEKEITVLRHGTPTKDPDLLQRLGRGLGKIFGFLISETGAVDVIPEYEAYLMATKDKQTLYVNHQQYGKGNPEGERSNAIYNLQKKYSNFHFLSLPFDGFFWKESYLANISLDQLKEDLFKAIMKEEKGFTWPTRLKKDPEQIRSLLDKVHSVYLKDKQDSKTFILLFYSELKDYLKQELDIDYLVSACKDNKDRGNASALVDMMKNLVLLNLENDPNRLKELFFTALAPYVIKNESIISERLEMALHVFEHFKNMSDQQKEEIRKYKEESGFTIVDQKIPKEETGPALKMNAAMFQECLHQWQKETRTVSKEDFLKNVTSDFYKEDKWNLAKLQKQVARDLPCLKIQYNGNRIVEFETLIDHLQLRDTFERGAPKNEQEHLALQKLSLLQQGAFGELMQDPNSYLSNPYGFILKQKAILSSICLHQEENGEWEVNITQEFVFTNPDEETSYPIISQAHVTNGKTTISWHFS